MLLFRCGINVVVLLLSCRCCCINVGVSLLLSECCIQRVALVFLFERNLMSVVVKGCCITFVSMLFYCRCIHVCVSSMYGCCIIW